MTESGKRPVNRRMRKSRRRTNRPGQRLFETLEPRRLLAVTSVPSQPLSVIGQPIAIESGWIDSNASHDLVALGRSGELAVALNGGDNSWASVRQLTLNLGPAYGMASGLLNADANVDLVVVGAQSAQVLLGSRDGQFLTGVTLEAPAGARWKSTDDGLAGAAIGLIDNDALPDVVLLDTLANRVFVWHGRGDGSFSAAQNYASGSIDPISVSIGDVVGDTRRDIAIGHRDGTVAFLRGSSAGGFMAEPSATVTRAEPIRDLAIADIDGDGDQDLAVSAGIEAFLMLRDPHPLPASPIANGDFAQGLTGWTVASVGHEVGGRAGSVTSLGGMAQLNEHGSLLTSISQSFIVPPSPQTISLDVEALGLEFASGAIPDAFEVSLLGRDQQSLVATHLPAATSFFNAVGHSSGTPAVYVAAGVSFDGRHIELDISHLLPGTFATLFIDLVGQPPGDGATVTVDNLEISPSTILSHSFTLESLSGPFTASHSIDVGDVNGDTNRDIIITDRGANRIVIFNGGSDGSFVRSTLDTLAFGMGPLGLTLNRFNADDVDDIAFTLVDSVRVVTPLGADTTAPQVSFISPQTNARLTAPIDRFSILFSEPVLDVGAAGNHSVTNTSAYMTYEFGSNGLDDSGLGDDRNIPLQSVVYEANTRVATITFVAGQLPLAEGRYGLIVRGDNSPFSIRDLANNHLAGGTNVHSTFIIDPPPQLAPVTLTPGTLQEGSSVTLSATFTDGMLGGPYTAVIDWADGSQGQLTSLAAPGSISGSHVYADNGAYEITVTLRDSAGRSVVQKKNLVVDNANPTLTAAGDLPFVSGIEFETILATFSDLGFTNPGVSSETFAASIDWGDGSAVEPASLTVQSGSPGVPSTGVLRGQHRYANPGTFSVVVTLVDDDGGNDTVTLQALVTTSANGRCLPSIDFETDASGNSVPSGQIAADQFAAWGVSISTPTGSKLKPRVVNWFNTVDATTPGAAELGNVLILSAGSSSNDHDHDDNHHHHGHGHGHDHGHGHGHEDEHKHEDEHEHGNGHGHDGEHDHGHGHGHDDDHHDDGHHDRDDDDRDEDWSSSPGSNEKWPAERGTLVFTFNSSVVLDAIALLGARSSDTTTVRLYSPAGTLIKTLSKSGLAGGAKQNLTLDARNVARMELVLSGKTAVSDLVFCSEPSNDSHVSIAGPTSVAEGDVVTVQLSSSQFAATEWLINWSDGAIDRLSGNATFAPHTFVDGAATRKLYATARDAAGNVMSANQLTINVANVAPSLTISGASEAESGVLFKLHLAALDPGTDTLSEWRIDWGDGVTERLPGKATSAQHTYRSRAITATNLTIHAAARDEDNRIGNVYTSNSLTVRLRPDTSYQFPTIDFERTAVGARLKAGDRISDQFASFGLTVTTNQPTKTSARIFDTAAAKGSSRDLGSPNSSFGGPGQGSGGAKGKPGENRNALFNVLVISKLHSAPDDLESGGTLIFNFAQPTLLDEVHLLDIDKSGSIVRLYAQNGALIASHAVANRGANSFQIVPLNASHVSRMEIVLAGGGAVASVVSRRENAPIPRPESRFFVVDTDDNIFRYSAPGSDIGDFRISSAANARGVATTADANPLWIVSEEGAEDRVYVYDTATESLIGSWKALGVSNAQGIATDGTDIWIVDSTADRVLRFAGAASRRSGSMTRTDSFALNTLNREPTDVVTNGSSLWVVDAGTDRVYAYNRGGTLINQWTLDPANKDPSGIAINPRVSDGIFVLDSVDMRVYSYTHRTLTQNGAQTASSSFPLSADNKTPTGIADPGGQISIGDTVNGSLNSPGEVVEWTFTANAGQQIYINFQDLSNWMQSDLIAPGGQLLYSKNYFRPGGLDSGTLTLAASGLYTLRLTSTSNPSYRFRVFDIPGPDVQPIAIGQTQSGAIDSPGRPDHWTFSGNSGQRLYLDFLSLSTVVGGDLVVDVVAPSGAIISTRTSILPNSLDQAFALTESGDHKLVLHAAFDGSQLPSYSFQLWQVPEDDVGTLNFRQPASGVIEVAGARDRWQFTATAGKNVFVDFNSLTGGDLRVQLIQPDGVQLSSVTFSLAAGLDREFILPQAGNYTLLIDGGGTANLNTYQFTLWDIPPETVEQTTINTNISGSLVPGQSVPFEFQGRAGTPILLDVIESNARSLAVTVIRPDGQTLIERATTNILATFPQTGTYKAIVTRASEFTLDSHGAYAFRIQDASTPEIGNPDNLGTKFYVAFPSNLREPFAPNNPTFSLSITSASHTSGTVQIPGLGFSTTYSVSPGTTTLISLPSTVEIATFEADAVVNKGILVTALDEVAVYALDKLQVLTEGFTALPTDAIGKEYYVLGYANTIPFVIGGGTNLTIAGTVDNTQVTITPAVAVGSHPAGVPFSITLGAGQAYTLHTGIPLLADLTGTRVTATQPITVLGGNTAARIPQNFIAANHIVEQLPPLAAWGRRFITMPLATRTNGDTFRILAQTDGTQVRINGVLVRTLAAGQFDERILTTASIIEGSAPLLVAQYSNSSAFDGAAADPFMMLVPPFEQFLSDYTLSTPASTFDINYANIVVPTSAVNSVTLDGVAIPASSFVGIGSSGYSGGQIPISVGSHRFLAAQPFGISIYGYAAFDAYGYFGGMRVGSIASVAALNLTPGTATLPVGTLHTVTAALADALGGPVHGVRVDFVISGIETRYASAVTDRDGRASLQLQRATVGTDSITATAVGLSRTASVTWHVSSPTITVSSPDSGAQLVIGRHLVTGRAVGGSPGAFISEVTANGRRVDALEAAGNFFAPVDIQAGTQTIIFTATDSLGLQSSTALTLTGVLASSEFESAHSSDVTTSSHVTFSRTTFNRKTNRLLADLRLVNQSPSPLDRTVAARIDRISSARVTLDSPDAISQDGQPMLLFDTELPENGLAAGQSSTAIAVAFADPVRDRFAVEVSILASGNRPPRFVSAPELQAAMGRTYRYAVQALDPDSSRISYSLASAPDGMLIDASTGEVEWTASSVQQGTHQVSIVASDARGGSATQSFSLTAVIAPTNRPPVFTTAPNTGALLLGSNYRYSTGAHDVDNDPLLYELIEGPVGMSIHASSGLISYDAAQAGNHKVAIRVSDGRGGTASQHFILSVGSTTGISSPSIVSTPPVTAVFGSEYVYSLSAVDPMQAALTFSLGNAPAGMTINSNTGRITWQPSAAQVGTTSNVHIEVRNALGGLAAQAYAVTVLAQRPGSPPIFVSSPTLIATVGQTYADTAIAEDPEQQPLLYALATAPLGMTIGSSSGQLAWTPTAGDLGPHRILVTATDAEGLVGYQQFSLSVRGVNTPPVFTSLPVLTGTAGLAYRHNAVAFDTEDEVWYALVTAPDGMLIGQRSGALTWRPLLESVGSHAVTVRATDARGLFAEQSYTLTVAGDTQAPVVDLLLSAESVEIGSNVTIRALASDNVAVTSLTLLINGTPLTVNVDGETTYTASTNGFQIFTATARDASGNESTARAMLRVRSASDIADPTVAFISPADGSTVTNLTDLLGTVTDPNLESYVLESSRINSNDWTTLTSRSIIDGGPIDIVAGLVGVFDPTLLLNDQYEVRLSATDVNGRSSSASILLNLAGNAKIGVLDIASAACQDCSSGDLSIPVAGGPAITINRQYSTLTVDESGDFGQGWQFCMAEPNLRETIARSEFEDIVGQFGALPFRDGQKVYITTPACERVGFTFSPTRHTGVWSEVGLSFYDPRWVPDPGVDWQLYGENDFTRLTGIASGEFDLDGLPLPLLRFQSDQYILAAISAAYNPLGYQLISKDGTRYHYSQTKGLLDVTDRNGNKLTMTDSGLSSSSGQSVQFQRDVQGRITKIIDDQGRETTYSYNAHGELAKVQYPSGLSDTYRYTSDHLLSAINGDNAQQEMLSRSFEYDVAGRLAVTLNALGYSNTQSYDLTTGTQTNFDALGNATTYRYDQRGNIVYERSPTGAEVTMQYDVNDNRTRITDELGFHTSFTYDARRNVTQVTDALGNRTDFAYNAANNVVYQRDGRGGEYFYDYDDQQNIIRARQPGGGDARLTYDRFGRLLSVTDVDGRVKRYEYANLAMPIRVIERDNNTTDITYNDYGHMLSYIDSAGSSLTFTYDAHERPVTSTDALGHVTRMFYSGRAIERVVDALGNETRYVFDAEFRPLQVKHPDGGVTVLEYDPNGRRVAMTDPNGNRTQTTYRADGRILSVIDAQGGVTAYEYDPVGRTTAIMNPNGHRWQTEYDALGYVSATIDPLGGRTSSGHDAMGNLTRQTDPLGRTTHFEYNSIQRPTRLVNALGGETVLTYAWDGRLQSEKDAHGGVHTYTYDALNRLTSTTNPLGNVEQIVYDSAGNRTQFIDRRGAVTRIAYDALHRPVEVIDASGAAIAVEYDALGRMSSWSDASGATTSTTYDAVGRVVSSTDPLGGVQRFAYDLAGNLLSVSDALERLTTFTYDSLNRQTSKTDPLGSVTRRTYDVAGNLKTLRDPLGNVTTFVYDAREWFIGSIDPQGYQASLAYDAVGNVTQTIDRDGLETQFTYDALDRLAGERWLTDGSVVNSASYSYDLLGNVLSAGDDFSSGSFAYDALRRLIVSDNALTPAAPHVVLTATYDATGNRTRLADSAGVSVSSTYDARNLLASRAWSGGGVTAAHTDFTYDARGLLSEISRYASLDTTSRVGDSLYQYDTKGRLIALTHADATSHVIADYSYVRDLADQLVEETHHGHSYKYDRDAFGQLIRATVDDVQSELYAYDGQGNRISSGEVIAADNRLMESATARLSYDREGNLIQSVDKATGEVRQYLYDHRHRLVTGTRTSAAGVLLSQVTNTYDVFNRRIARTVDVDGAGPQAAVTTHTVYDGEHAWADYDASGTVIARYLYGDATDQLLARWRPAEGTAWYLTDHLGSVRDITDAGGSVINTLDYDSFGRIVSQTNSAYADRFAYTGREWDAELELYYYRARFYDATTGRFISQDPLGFAAGDTNLYRYVGNNPLDFTDPSGNLAAVECAMLRNIQMVINVACPVLEMAFNGSLQSQDIDQQVENTFAMMNVAFGALPFGSSLALQTTLRAITIVQTSQALASLNVNEHLFSLLEIAETYVVESHKLYEQGAAATFQEALSAFAQSDNRGLLLTRFLCGAANMGIMALSAKARCFVAGTPVLVGLLPPDEQPPAELADSWGPSVIDVLAGLAVGSAILLRRRPDRDERRARALGSAADYYFDDLDRESDHEQPKALTDSLTAAAHCAAASTYRPLALAAKPVQASGAQPFGSNGNPVVANSCDERIRGRRIATVATFLCLLLAVGVTVDHIAAARRDGSAIASPLVAREQLIALEEPRSPSRKKLLQPIETIRCGQRIVAELPLGVTATSEPEPDATTWRMIEVEVTGVDGHRVEVHLLRPQHWLDQSGVAPNGEFPLRLEELGVEGTAAVLRIGPCPNIDAGPGQVVTGTFRHSCDSLVDVQLVGSDSAITCTSGHPIWSEDRGSFVAAAALHSGEQVRLHSHAIARVDFQRPHPGSASVFNLEVNQHHVYHVGQHGLLVHNSGLDCDVNRDEKHAVEEMVSNGELSVINSVRAGATRVPRHHVFAQKLFGTVKQTKNWFEERGLDIDKVTVEVTQGEHEAIHKWVGSKGWNAELRQRLIRSESQLERKLSAREIWRIGYRLLREAGVRDATFLPY